MRRDPAWMPSVQVEVRRSSAVRSLVLLREEVAVSAWHCSGRNSKRIV
jgi:hypothetical protein